MINSDNEIVAYMVADAFNFKDLKAYKADELKTLMTNHKIKLYNAALVGDIKGIVYNLRLLPTMFKGKWMNNDKYFCAFKKDDKYTLFKINNTIIEPLVLKPMEMLGYLTKGAINNAKGFMDVNCEDLGGCKMTLSQLYNQSHKSQTASTTKEDARSKQSIDKQKERLEFLKKDVTNPDTHWTLDDFETYMKGMGYSYAIDGDKLNSDTQAIYIDFIDPRCKNIKLPDIHFITREMLDLDSVSGSITIDSIITYANCTYFEIPKHYNNEWLNIKKLMIRPSNLYPEGYTQMSLPYGTHIGTLDIDCDVITGSIKDNGNVKIDNIYIKATKVVDSFTACDIKNIVFDNVKRVEGSFNNVGIDTNLLSLNIEYLKSSFSYVRFDKSVLIDFPEIIEHAEYSFNSNGVGALEEDGTSPIIEVNFNKAINMSTFYNMFNEAKNILSADLSMCYNLKYFCGFQQTGIKSLKLPDGLVNCQVILTKFRDDYSSDCGMKELVIPDSVNLFSISAPGTTITLPNKEIVLDSSHIIGSLGNCVITNAECIKRLSNKSLQPNGIYNPEDGSVKNIESLDDLGLDLNNVDVDIMAFAWSTITNIDLRKLKLTKDVLYAETFRGSKIQNLVIGGTVKKCVERVFYNMSYLKNVFFEDDVEVSKDLFCKDESNNFVIYCTENSKFYNEFKSARGKKLNIVLVDDINEPIDRIMGAGTTDVRQQNKYFMFLSNTEHEDLLKQPYLKNIATSYGLILSLDKNAYVAKNKLNTSKFKSVPLDSCELGKELINVLAFRGATLISSDEALNPKFVGLCNFLTTYLDNYIDYIQYVNVDRAWTYIQQVYDNAAIVVMKVRSNYKATVDNCVYVDCALVVINNNITFMGVVNINGIHEHWSRNGAGFNTFKNLSTNLLSKTTIYDINSNWVNSLADNKYSISSELIPGDALCNGDIIVHGATLPHKYYDRMYESLMQGIKFIGTNCTVKQMEVNEFTRHTLWYDCFGQRFLILSLKFNTEIAGENRFDVYSIEDIKCVKEFKLNDLKSVPNNLTKKLLPYLNYADGINTLKLLKNSVVKAVISDDDYDITDVKDITTFADAMYKYGVNTLEKATPKILNAMFSLNLFKYENVSVNDIRKLDLKTDVLSINSEDLVLLQYTNLNYETKDYTYFYVLCNGDTLLTKRGIVVHSLCNIRDIISILYIMGKNRAENRFPKTYSIADPDLDVESVAWLYTFSSLDHTDPTLKIDIALDYMTGYTYLVAETNDMDFKKMFRTKGAFETYELVSSMLNSDDRTNYWDMVNFADFVLRGYNKGELYSIRKLIVKGLPNSDVYDAKFSDWLSILAKEKPSTNN